MYLSCRNGTISVDVPSLNKIVSLHCLKELSVITFSLKKKKEEKKKEQFTSQKLDKVLLIGWDEMGRDSCMYGLLQNTLSSLMRIYERTVS